jgi:hypothetical protein
MIIALKNIRPIEKIKIFSAHNFLIIAVFFLLFGAEKKIYSQSWRSMKYELTGGITINSLFGDIGGYPSSQNMMGLKDLQISMLRPGFDLGLRYKFNSQWSVKGGIDYSLFSASDKGSKNDARSLSVSTSAISFGGQGEYSIISEDEVKRKRLTFSDGLVNSIGLYNLYVLAGFKVMSFTPVLSNPAGIHIATNETITGRGLALIVPIGVGFKYFINNRLSLTSEFTACFSTSDYLDGYSTSFSKANDFFYQLKIGFAYKLYSGKTGLPSFSPNRR